MTAVLEPQKFEWLLTHWTQFRPGFERTASLTNGEFTAEDLLDFVKEGIHLPVSVTVDDELLGCLLYEKIYYRRTSRLRVFAVSGLEHEKWFEDAIRATIVFARNLGLDGVETYARPGLAKRLKGLGYKAQSTFMVTN
jgi:hypothetical protein